MMARARRSKPASGRRCMVAPLLAAFTIALLLVAGCGSDTDDDQPTPASQPVDCEGLAYQDGGPLTPSPVLTFCNDTTERLKLQRVDVRGRRAVTVPSDSTAVLYNTKPALGTIDDADLRTGQSVTFAVTAPDGAPRGRIVLGPAFLLDDWNGRWLCLSMASEPPRVLAKRDEVPNRCPGLAPRATPYTTPTQR